VRTLTRDTPLHQCATYEVVSPRELALHVLHARFGHAVEDVPEVDSASDIGLAPHQVDAVAAAEAIIARYGGAIVADSVGLGKTFVALAVVERAVAAGTLVQIVVPAALRTDWRRHIERVCPAAQKARTVRLLTHTHLSRIRSDAVIPPAGLVVVDEAHAFRNADTRRYAALARLCAGAHVLLVTATPVSNSVLDFYHLIRLFAGNDAFTHLGIADLTTLFRAVARNEVSLDPVARVVRAVTVRRTRAFLRGNYGGLFVPGGASVTFPRAAPPMAVHYSFAKNAFCESLSLLGRLRFTAARAARVELNATGGAELLRFLLLKRLDSSAAAFEATLERQIAFHQRFLDHLSNGRLLTARADLNRERGGDPLQLSFEELVVERVPRGVPIARMQQDVRTDLATLCALREVTAPTVQNDPKLAALQHLLINQLEGHKVLVFTEFRDTARHVWRALARHGGASLVVGEESRLGLMVASRAAVINRFAPVANHARMPAAREAVRWLIATDVLSEGLNLQDADVVVSYDLPWNPVRLLQRVGRIDRIGSAHATVRSFHFLPEDGLETMLGVVGRLARKAETIRRTLGDDESLVGLSCAAEVVGRLNRSDAAAFDIAERDALLDADSFERCRLLYLAARRAGWRPRTTNAGAAQMETLRAEQAEQNTRVMVAAMTDLSARETCAWVLNDGRGRLINPAGLLVAARNPPSLDTVLARCVDVDPPVLEPSPPLVAAGLDVAGASSHRGRRRALLQPAALPRTVLRLRKLAARLPLDAGQCARLDRLSLAARSCDAGGAEAFEMVWAKSGLTDESRLPGFLRFLDEAEALMRLRRRPLQQSPPGFVAILEIRALAGAQCGMR
jgi:superfamily II DNA or RNA helicase